MSDNKNDVDRNEDDIREWNQDVDRRAEKYSHMNCERLARQVAYNMNSYLKCENQKQCEHRLKETIAAMQAQGESCSASDEDRSQDNE